MNFVDQTRSVRQLSLIASIPAVILTGRAKNNRFLDLTVRSRCTENHIDLPQEGTAI
jgi:hypothetical protein